MYSSNLEHLLPWLPACDTWDDHRWAYFMVCVDKQVEHEIRLHCTHNRPLEELPLMYLDKV